MTPSYVCHDWVICVLWLLLMCAMTQSYVCYDSFLWVAWLIHRCAMTLSYVCHDFFICVPWLMHISGVPHSCVGHELFIVRRDSFIRVIPFECVTRLKVCGPWLIHLIIHLTQWHVTWIIHMLMIASYVHSHVWHDSITCDMIHLFIYDVAHSYVAWIFHVCIDSLTCDISLHYIWMDSYDSFIHELSHELSHSLWHVSPIYALTHMFHSYTDWLSHLW